MLKPAGASLLILDFIVQVVQAVAVPLESIPVYDYHWQLVVASAVRVLKVLHYPRALAEHAVDFQLRGLAIVVSPRYAYVVKHALEYYVGKAKLIVVALEFHLARFLVVVQTTIYSE